MKIAVLAVTPDIQLIVDPALNPNVDVLGFFGIRLRAAFQHTRVIPRRSRSHPADVPKSRRKTVLIFETRHKTTEFWDGSARSPSGPVAILELRWSRNHASDSQQAYRTQHTYDRKPFTPGFSNPNVFEVFVKSSAVVSTGYDRTKETLYIKFKNGSVYAYLRVPESVFSAFLAADSN